MTHWLLLLATIVLTALANILLKYSALNRKSEVVGIVNTLWELATTPTWVLGIFCLGVAVIAYGIALRNLNLSVAYPVMTTSVVVLVAIASVFLFGEPFTLVKTVGTAAIICGVFLISI